MKEDDESGEIKRRMAASKRSGRDVEKAKEGERVVREGVSRVARSSRSIRDFTRDY